MTQRTQYTTPVDNAGVFAISNSDGNAAQHTPRPWERKARQKGKHRREIYGDGRHIATVHAAFGERDTTDADVALISAAPDLLAALEAMSQLPDDWCMSVDDCALWDGSNVTGHSPLCSYARAAIAKARGAPQDDRT